MIKEPSDACRVRGSDGFFFWFCKDLLYLFLKQRQDSVLNQLVNRGDIQLSVRPVHGDDKVVGRIDPVEKVVCQFSIVDFAVSRIIHHTQMFQIDFAPVGQLKCEIRVNRSPPSIYPFYAQWFFVDGCKVALPGLLLIWNAPADRKRSGVAGLPDVLRHLTLSLQTDPCLDF